MSDLDQPSKHQRQSFLLYVPAGKLKNNIKVQRSGCK